MTTTVSTCACTGPTTGDHLCPCRRKAEDARQAAQRAASGVFSPWNACCYREGCRKRATDYAALETKLREALRDAGRYRRLFDGPYPFCFNGETYDTKAEADAAIDQERGERAAMKVLPTPAATEGER